MGPHALVVFAAFLLLGFGWCVPCRGDEGVGIFELWHLPREPRVYDDLEVHVRISSAEGEPRLKSFSFLGAQSWGGGTGFEFVGDDEWVAVSDKKGDVRGYQVSLFQNGTWILSDILLVKHSEWHLESDEIEFDVWTEDQRNRSLPELAVIKANIRSPHGMDFIQIERLRYGSTGASGMGGGRMHDLGNGTYVDPGPGRPPHTSRFNWTDAVCFFVIHAVDNSGKYADYRGNVTVGKPRITLHDRKVLVEEDQLAWMAALILSILVPATSPRQRTP